MYVYKNTPEVENVVIISVIVCQVISRGTTLRIEILTGRVTDYLFSHHKIWSVLLREADGRFDSSKTTDLQ